MLYSSDPLLLQITEGVRGVVTAASGTTEQMQKDALTSFLWTTVLFLAVVSLGLGIALVKNLNGHNASVESACKTRLEGYAKSEGELKIRHATEIAINEANHQNITKGLQKSLDDSNQERRELHHRINTMAGDMAELFETFAGKINTFTELQASLVARLETFRLEFLLEINKLFSAKK